MKVLLLRLAIKLGTSKKFWTALLSVIAGVAVFVFLCFGVFSSILTQASEHNKQVVTAVFEDKVPSIFAPADYKQYIATMQNSFHNLDSSIKDINKLLQSGTLDGERVKAAFFVAHVTAEHPIYNQDYCRRFADCFVSYQTVADRETGETTLIAHQLIDLDQVYRNIEQAFSMSFNDEMRTNATEVYYLAKYGDRLLEPGNVHSWINQLEQESNYTATSGEFNRPLSDPDWLKHVSSPFGKRTNPTSSGKAEYHTGIDIAQPKGTPIHAVKGGKVLFVRKLNRSYGYHLAIDHGGGVVSMYCHCSEILVSEGQEVAAGQTIAKVGSTGRSTGNHLHLEIIVNGKSVNPLKYVK